MFGRLVAAAAIVLLAASCSGRSNAEGSRSTSQPDSIVVEAYNENFYEARVHAVFDGGQRRTLGTIPGNGGRTETTIPWQPRALVFEIQFIISGAEYISHPVDVVPGETVEVRLPSNIAQSGFFRRVSRD